MRMVAFGKRFVLGSEIVERIPNYQFWTTELGVGIISD